MNLNFDNIMKKIFYFVALVTLSLLFMQCETNKIGQNGVHKGHEYVDLGLSVKWATCNVGATTPEGSGDYFAWGEVEPKDYYYWDSYKERQDTNLIGSFIDNITKSRKEYDWEDYPSRKEYVLYTEGCLYLSPEVRKRAEGKYFDPQKSYELFTEIVNIDDYDVDDNILKNAKENKEKLETKFSGFLKKKI